MERSVVLTNYRFPMMMALPTGHASSPAICNLNITHQLFSTFFFSILQLVYMYATALVLVLNSLVTMALGVVFPGLLLCLCFKCHVCYIGIGNLTLVYMLSNF